MTKPSKRETAQQFGSRAAAYAESRTHAAGSDLEILIRVLAPVATDSILDIATGPGHTALAVAPHVREVMAIDLAPEMVAQARRLIEGRGIPNVRARVMDVEALDFPDGSFDAVTCRIAPHHFPDVDRSLAEIARVIKPDGRFVLEDSCAPPDPDADCFLNEIEALRDPTHVRSYNESEWREMLGRTGLRVVHSEIYRKEHAFEEWLERSATPQAARDTIRGMLIGAPPAIRAAFHIALEDGRPVRFTDEKLILRADRRGSVRSDDEEVP